MRRLFKVLLLTVGTSAALLVIAEIILSSSFATKTVNRFASEYVDGDIEFGKVSLSVFRDFPGINLTLDDFTITYPADRFDAAEKKGVQGHLMYHGCGSEADTLASFRKFSASIRALPLLFGKVDIPEVELVRARIFAHRYDPETANWNIFRLGEAPEAVETAAEDKDVEVKMNSSADPVKMPEIHIGRISLENRPHIIYTDCCDTIFAMIGIRKMGLNGRISPDHASRNRIEIQLDSMFIAGRVSRDTMAVRLDRISINEHRGQMDFSANAKTLLATRAFGRMNIPIDISGSMHLPKDSVPVVSIDSIKAEIADIPFAGYATLRFLDGRTGIKGEVEIPQCRVNDVITGFIKNIVPEAGKISTDAVVSMKAECDGEYVAGTGRLPAFEASLTIPHSTIRHREIAEKVSIMLQADASGSRNGKVDVSVRNLKMKTAGLDIQGKGGARNVMSSDPLLEIDGTLKASLDSLLVFVPDSLGIKARGMMRGSLKGSARVSNLDIYNFSNADLEGNLTADRILFRVPKDTISISVQKMNLGIGPEMRTSRRDSSRTFRLIGLNGTIGKADISYKRKLRIMGEEIAITARNSAPKQKDTSRINRLSGTVSAKMLSLKDASGSQVKLDETSNNFRMSPKRGTSKVPVLSFSSSNRRINLQTDVNRAILTGADIEAKATLNTVERRMKREAFLDSLARVYPEVPRDSLFRHMMARRKDRAVPEWLKEEDFRKQDLNIRLDQSLARYFREWDLEGKVDIRTGALMTPYFPLMNILRGFELGFDNDRIGIDSLKVMSGKSTIEAKGALSGLRRTLLGRGTLKLDLDIASDKINANELLRAYSNGASFNPASITGDISQASNAEYLDMVTQDIPDSAAAQPLIVIPSNLNADISINATGITYSDLEISSLTSNLIMKERCVQITDALATSNMGDIGFEGFYATRSKKDIKAGFNFNCRDITAEKAIALMPAVDSIMPLLKSFAGNLNCEVAATASLDTNMNILTPSINGVLRISGDDLSISNSPLYTSIAKKLKFDNSKSGKIQHMNVEGVIKDNVMEVFPFVLSLDRYTLALSGKQNFDMSYRYHASIIKSPLIIKLGVDVYGKDFDNMKFKIGKPKYKTEDVPVFSTVINNTRINLVEAIHGIFEKGVEAAIKENERLEAINELKKKIGYVNAVDMEMQDLSEEEKKELEASTAEEDTPPSTTNETVVKDE